MIGSLAYLSFVRYNDWAGVIKVVLDDWYPKITTCKGGLWLGDSHPVHVQSLTVLAQEYSHTYCTANTTRLIFGCRRWIP
jgi:hypothetical protein